MAKNALSLEGANATEMNSFELYSVEVRTFFLLGGTLLLCPIPEMSQIMQMALSALSQTATNLFAGWLACGGWTGLTARAVMPSEPSTPIEK